MHLCKRAKFKQGIKIECLTWRAHAVLYGSDSTRVAKYASTCEFCRTMRGACPLLPFGDPLIVVETTRLNAFSARETGSEVTFDGSISPSPRLHEAYKTPCLLPSES